MNEYFNAPTTPVDFTVARGSAIKAIFAGIAAAFDKLPGRNALLQGRVNFAVAGGTANALTAAFAVAPEEYVEGASFRLKLSQTNTGAATLNVNGLGAAAIVDAAGVALVGGELVTSNVQDFTYIDGAFRLPATGPRGPQGQQGVQGASGGLTLLNGAGAPGAGTGSNGDFYIQVIAGVPTNIFGPKAAGAWPAGVSMIGANGLNGANGANGTNGNTILNGAGAPGGGTGVNGDFYIDTSTAPWTIYGPKAAGAWAAGTPLGDITDVAFTGTNTVNALEIGFRDLPISRNVSANFTLAAADRGKAITYDDTGDICTVPLNSSVAIGVGAMTTVVNNGTGPLAIAREGAVVMKLAGTGANANRSLAVGGVAWFWKIATNTWFCGGPGLT
jgi:hypothetical protein